LYVNEPAIIATSDLGLYLLAGECILGFLHPDGFLIELIVQAEEYIKVPARIRHWFSLSALLQVKAVRYFATAANKINVPCSSN
jgi:cupin superfamily acireductone dioxygenase involved in methionine salvage